MSIECFICRLRIDSEQTLVAQPNGSYSCVDCFNSIYSSIMKCCFDGCSEKLVGPTQPFLMFEKSIYHVGCFRCFKCAIRFDLAGLGIESQDDIIKPDFVNIFQWLVIIQFKRTKHLKCRNIYFKLQQNTIQFIIELDYNRIIELN